MARKPIDHFRVPAVFKSRTRLRGGKAASATGVESAVAVGSATSVDPPEANPTTLKDEPSADSATSASESASNPGPEFELIEDEAPESVAGQKPRERVRSQVFRGMRSLAAPLMWLGVLAFLGGTGVSAFWWLTSLPPLPNCSRLQPLLASDSDKLYCAEQAARSGQTDAIVAGLNLVKGWGNDHPLHNRATKFVKDWSRIILSAAYQKAEQNDLDTALELAQEIPPSSSNYKDAQAAVSLWRKQRNQGQLIKDAFRVALKAGDWKAAEEQLQALSRFTGDYWRRYFNQMRQQILIERIAQRQLQQVRQQSTSALGNPEALGQVIAIADQINPISYVRPEAEAELARLSQALLEIVRERLNQGNLAGAIAATQWFPDTIPTPQEARDLIWFSRALPLATAKIPAAPLYAQLWQLWIVLPQLRQIDPKSPLYSRAQALIPKLEQQTQDLMQIQVATAVANLGQVPALQTAIGLAQAIAPNRPQRIYAQTLIAQWRKEVQTAEDRPYLIEANQLAAKGSIADLKAAIVQARRIALGRPLRIEAQTAIADWLQKIQVLEDQPTLQQAQALAKQQKLAEAIQTAAKIPANRALHAQAQAEIQKWTAQLQAAEDQPILNQAQALADQGSLSAAINTAYQIAPGRALYGEAQSAIARWESQRAASRRAQTRSEAPSQEQSGNTRESESTSPSAQPRSQRSPEPAELPPP